MNLTEEHQEAPCFHSNFSCLQTSPTAVDVLLYISAAVVVSVTVCGNLLVIISICHFRQLQTPTNFLLLSLAMADFLVGVIVMPLFFTMLTNPQRCFNILDCAIFSATSSFATISIYNVALIAVDRCFALANPFYYSMKMTVNLTLRIIAMMWLFSLIYTGLYMYFSGYITNLKDIACGDCTVPGNKVWSTIDCILVFVLPFSIIIIMYLNIFAIARKHANKIRSDRKSQKTTNIGSLASERKAAKSLGILVAVFLLCLVPYFISVFVDMHFSNRSVQLALSISFTLLYLNSSINPIIYALFYPWFRKSVKLILTLRICDTDSSVLNVLERDT